MNHLVFTQPLGRISSVEDTQIYTATSDWQLISGLLQIRMYQTRPGSRESVERPSIALPAEKLWPLMGDIRTELYEWDGLSDEALINFEAGLG